MINKILFISLYNNKNSTLINNLIGETMPEELNIDAMIERFRQRSIAVKQRGVPPIEGPERKRFIEQAQLDFMDYAIIGDAEGTIEDGILTLRINLAPQEEEKE